MVFSIMRTAIAAAALLCANTHVQRCGALRLYAHSFAKVREVAENYLANGAKNAAETIFRAKGTTSGVQNPGEELIKGENEEILTQTNPLYYQRDAAQRKIEEAFQKKANTANVIDEEKPIPTTTGAAERRNAIKRSKSAQVVKGGAKKCAKSVKESMKRGQKKAAKILLHARRG